MHNASIAGLVQARASYEPARSKLLKTREAITHGRLGVADTLDAQGATSLAGEVRYFAHHLPRGLTDKERVAVAALQHLANNERTPHREHARENACDLSR
jgi:hypothetical protein